MLHASRVCSRWVLRVCAPYRLRFTDCDLVSKAVQYITVLVVFHGSAVKWGTIPAVSVQVTCVIYNVL